MPSKTLPSVETVEDVFNLLETELALLKKYLNSSFLEQFEVFAPDEHAVPVATYNQRNTADSLDIEYRAEDRVTNHLNEIGVSQTH